MTFGRPVLVVDNAALGGARCDGYVAVCVVSLEGVGRTTSLLGSEAAGASVVEYRNRLSAMLREDDQLIQINEVKHCLLLRGLKDRNHAALAGLKMERLFGEPMSFGELNVALKVRAGIACGESGTSDAEELFRAAETARDAARRAHCVYQLADDLDLAAIHRRWQLNGQVEDALYEHQLTLYYQPKVSAEDHRLCGAEGLIRWRHPEGLLTPGQFLPHLEPDKLVAMTRHVVRQCVRDLAGAPWLPPLAINLDPEVLEDPFLLRLLQDELSMWDVDPGRVVVEVTENGIVSNLDGLLSEIAELRARGVRIAMDDFGTGNSSLAQFRDLPVDELKIDRSFVAGLESDPSNRYLIDLMVQLGHYFDMKVVAEGVETLAVAQTLAEIGCDVLQGFYFAPPLPLEEFSRWAGDRPGASTS